MLLFGRGVVNAAFDDEAFAFFLYAEALGVPVCWDMIEEYVRSSRLLGFRSCLACCRAAAMEGAEGELQFLEW